MTPPRHIALVVNSLKNGAKAVAEQLFAIGKTVEGVEIQAYDYPFKKDFLKGSDVCCTIGGDGTLLAVGQEAVQSQTLLFGINCGRLGFTSSCSAHEAEQRFNHLLLGHFQCVERKILYCQFAQHEAAAFAINDVVVKVEGPRMGHFSVVSSGKLVNHYACDGLIFCSPTGSTAYNLSAGGPLIEPDAAVIVMTAICPHSLGSRTIIFSDKAELTIILDEANENVRVSQDGQTSHQGASAFPLQLRVAPKPIRLVQFPDYSYYGMLREKLNWK